MCLCTEVAANTNCEATASSPEDEDEEHKEHAEGGHVVHSLHQHHELAAQCGHETHQLQHPQETESPQHREAPVRLADDLPDAMAQRGTGSARDNIKRDVNRQRQNNNAHPSYHLHMGSMHRGVREKIFSNNMQLELHATGLYSCVKSCISSFVNMALHVAGQSKGL